MASRHKKGRRWKVVAVFVAAVALLVAGYFSYPYLQKYYKRFFGSGEEAEMGAVVPMQTYRQMYPQYNLFGIDVSEYQGDVDWETLVDKNKIDFAFVRATAGSDTKDRNFSENWRQLKKYNVPRGAYHYYRPNENSTDQANLFIKTVVIEKGDFVPVLDIEKYSKVQSVTSLKNGLLNWLSIVEAHYGVVPIIYTYSNFYEKVITDDKRFKKYPIWIAHYSEKENPKKLPSDWVFWQFCEDGRLEGIETYVDIDLCSNAEKFKALRK
jgi:Lyzozyme M1 (1,4-beta-N-acetylmuramidase)